MRELGAIAEIAPDVAIKQERWREYDEWRQQVHRQILTLGCSVYILERITTPEFHWLMAPNQRDFWILTGEAHFAQSALVINMLWFDNGVDTKWGSLKRFGNAVSKEMVKPEYRSMLDEALGEVKLGNTVARTLSTVKDLRNGWIAHRTEKMTPKRIADTSITIHALKDLAVGLNDYFRVVCFGVEWHWLSIQYMESVGNAPITDIDEIITGEAKRNPMVNMAEDAEWWKRKKASLSSYDLSMIGYWREHLSLRWPV